MDKFLPDIYTKSIYTVNYENLKVAGIKIILFDLDNTIAPISVSAPSQKLIKLFEDIKNMGFKPIILSNRSSKRIEPFKNNLFIDAAARSMKPLSKKYKKIFKLYNVKPEEVAAIGDQLVTDIYGANRIGITSILVNPISSNELKIKKISRFLEKKILKKYIKNEVFKKGEYY